LVSAKVFDAPLVSMVRYTFGNGLPVTVQVKVNRVPVSCDVSTTPMVGEIFTVSMNEYLSLPSAQMTGVGVAVGVSVGVGVGMAVAVGAGVAVAGMAVAVDEGV